MRVEIRDGTEQSRNAKTIFLDAQTILTYMILEDEKTETMIMCKQPNTEMVTTDKEVYEALCSIKQYDNFDINKLKKFFENVDVKSYKDNTNNDKKILTFERVEELRNASLKNNIKT